MKVSNLRGFPLVVATFVAYSPAPQAAFWDFLIHPDLVNVVTTDPYLGNGDDAFFPPVGTFPGINNGGAASQFSFTNGNYGFLTGSMEVRSSTSFGQSPKLAFGLNQHNFVNMDGEWNNNFLGPMGTFNQPFSQTLNLSSPSIININSDQTYTTSFVLDDNGFGGRLQITGNGQYLLSSQNPSDLYTGDVLTHFDTVLPLLPGGWQSVSQETQTVEVLDGAFAGLTGVATVTFYSFDFGSAPGNPPTALGPPWATTGFTAESDGNTVIGGEPIPFNVIGGDGTGTLSGGDSAAGRELMVGIGLGTGTATITDPGTMFTADHRTQVQEGSLHITNGAKLYVDNASGSNPIASSVDSFAANALLVVDGSGSEIKVSGGTNKSIQTEPEGTAVTNYVAAYNGGRIEVKNGGEITVEGANSSSIVIGGFGFDPSGTSSSLLVEGQNSLIDGGSLITVGQHPDILDEFMGFLQPDSGLLELRDGGKAKADLVYIGTDGTVTGHDGTLEGNVENHGTIAPGDSPGILNIIGDYSQGPDGKLLLEIAGTSPGEFDVLNITGTATIAGTLEIVLLDGFTPDEMDTFDFLNPAALNGSFDDFIFPVFGNNKTFALESGPNGFSVSVAPVPLPPAVWLLGSAFAGLVWRRKRT